MPRNNMSAALGLFFMGLPLLEIALFIVVGRQIGVVPTIALTVLTTIVGISLARIEGFATLRAVDEGLKRGEPPVKEMLSGALIVIGGILLAIPGFFTDAIGVLLLIRPLRLLACAGLTRYFGGPGNSYRGRNGPRVIDVTAVEIDTDRRGSEL